MTKSLRAINFNDIEVFRAVLINEYCQHLHYMTANQKAKLLVGYARSKGLCDWKYMSGSLLEEFADHRPVSKWMVNAVFQILLSKKWQPEADGLWALFIKTWMYENGPFNHAGEVLDSLPNHVNKLQALEWVLFFHDRMKVSKRTQIIWQVTDYSGNKVIHDCISSKLAKEALVKKFPNLDSEMLQEEGYKLHSYAILIKDIDQHTDIPEYQRKLVRKKLIDANQKDKVGV